MAKRGFVAAQVAYDQLGWTGDVCADLDTMDQYAPSRGQNSVSAKTKAKSMVKAVDVLCAVDGADCSKGVAAHGFSMGSWIAALLPVFDERVTAVLLFGYGLEREPQECISSPRLSAHIEKSKRRIVNGVNDECFVNHNVMAQMRSLSGYDFCNGNDCLQRDGSGFYLVSPSDYTMGEVSSNVATHLFFRTGTDTQSTLFPSFTEQPDPWALTSNMDWLARAAVGSSEYEHVDLSLLSTGANDTEYELVSTNYVGVGISVGSEATWRIEGVKPKLGSGFPVYIWINGFKNSFLAVADQKLLLAMAERGFIAAQVAYDRLGWTGDVCAAVDTLDKYAPSRGQESVSARTKAKSMVKAIDVLCSLDGADCSRGVAAHGFSMGTWVAALLPMFDTRVTAVLLFGYGIEREPQNCIADAHLSVYIEKTRRRIVNGANDVCFANHDVMAQMRSLSGYEDCTDHHCLQEDGSGFYLVRPDEYTMGETHRNIATHLFFRTGIAPESDLLPSFVQQADGWGMQSNLDWLARTASKVSDSAHAADITANDQDDPTNDQKDATNDQKDATNDQKDSTNDQTDIILSLGYRSTTTLSLLSSVAFSFSHM
eukprot:TRINITY_DN3336_c0_g1_i11.p1 TRINITY_DN3336_c0_g1~~TRINITY_DN3336_c0_g1_i11.p1  ORF type:complete len:606 (-),score=100.70 TRINITY_DN3336_c0_g1_i11:262-2055(-)